MYGTAVGFTSYHEARGRTVPASWHTDFIESALLVASEWTDNKYGSLFQGYPTGGFTQERQWPRIAAFTNTMPSYVFATDEIPERVVHATYEAAFREATEAGTLQKDFTPSEYKRVSVDGAISVEYLGNQNVTDVQIQISIVEQLLRPLFDINSLGTANSLSGSLVRA